MDTNNTKALIEGLDLECIKFKLIMDAGWSLEKADQVEKLYKAFLYVCAVQDDFIPIPSRDMDEFWHYHILDTHKYHEECEAIFGHYLHHYPYIGVFDDDDPVLVDNYEKTKAVFLREFALDPSIGWEESGHAQVS